MLLDPTPETETKWKEWNKRNSGERRIRFIKAGDMQNYPDPVLTFHRTAIAVKGTHDHRLAPGAIITPDGQRLWTLEGWDHYTGQLICTPIYDTHPSARFTKTIPDDISGYAYCESLTYTKRGAYDLYKEEEAHYRTSPQTYGIPDLESIHDLDGTTITAPHGEQYEVLDAEHTLRIVIARNIRTKDTKSLDLWDVLATYSLEKLGNAHATWYNPH